MPTVLIVDDDPKFLNAAEQMLVTAGYRVWCAADGKQAVDILEKKHGEIDLTIVDLALPDTNGFELIGAITRRASAVRVIATTSIHKDAYLDMAGALGAHAAIRKPPKGALFPEGEWLGTVHRLIGDAVREKSGAAHACGTTYYAEPSHGTKSGTKTGTETSR
jgi:CheY-like chemotaxis protein